MRLILLVAGAGVSGWLYVFFMITVLAAGLYGWLTARRVERTRPTAQQDYPGS